jgi:hypothetical protein
MGLGVGEGTSGAATTYFSTNDIESAVARASELGANVLMPVTQVMDIGTMAILVDPFGADLRALAARRLRRVHASCTKKTLRAGSTTPRLTRGRQ